MLTLYYAPATASMCVHQLLIELGAEHELVKVDLESLQQKSPEYLRLNPNGVVPTLIIDDAPMIESSAILMVLAERYPHAGFSPGIEFDQIYAHLDQHGPNVCGELIREATAEEFSVVPLAQGVG